MYGEGGNFNPYFTNDKERIFMKRLLQELCSIKLQNWSFHRTFYLNKIVLRRSYKLSPACVIYWTGSSFISGYSLSTGRFLSARSSHLYVAGSPRNDDSRGKVSNLKKLTAPRRGYTSTILLHPLLYILHMLSLSPGARGSAVGWSTTLQVGRSRVRLEFFIDIILPAALWPWSLFSL